MPFSTVPTKATGSTLSLADWNTSIAANLNTLITRTGDTNILVNGGFEVWQRGTSFLGVTNGSQGRKADRWYALPNGTSSMDVTREATTIDTVGSYSQKVVYTHNTESSIFQDPEKWQGLVGQTLTFAFRANTTTASAVRSQIDYGTGVLFGSYHSGSGAWETTSVTVAIPAGATRIWCQIIFDASATIYLDNATLTIGSEALPYGPVDTPLEMLRCHRYYQTIQHAQRFTPTAANQRVNCHYDFPVEMPLAPSVTLIAGTRNLITSMAAFDITTLGLRAEIVSSGAGDCYSLLDQLVLEANP